MVPPLISSSSSLHVGGGMCLRESGKNTNSYCTPRHFHFAHVIDIATDRYLERYLSLHAKYRERLS